ncbi:MAG: peptidase [Lachnospiraceae bacterium]|nr:peptidase [Lachnospiraceae bacterium]
MGMLDMRSPNIYSIDIFHVGVFGKNIHYKAALLITMAAIFVAIISRLSFAQTQSNELYTFEIMQTELQEIASKYDENCALASLGQTLDGRDLWCLRIGSENASHSILITASIHAREYITTQLVMEQTKAFLLALKDDSNTYHGNTYRELINDTAIYVIPMVNPDGVSISQFGTDGLRTEEAKQSVYHIFELDDAVEIAPYLIKWKSNAEGIDLNRNFNALWERYDDHLGHPSSDHYKGRYPGCSVESQALIELTKKIHFDRTISYHTQGEVIYWYFGQTGDLFERTKSFAERIGRSTGYKLDDNMEALDPAGYKDWAISEMGIPSLTIETGTGTSPVPSEQFSKILAQNRYVWEETILSCIEN